MERRLLEIKGTKPGNIARLEPEKDLFASSSFGFPALGGIHCTLFSVMLNLCIPVVL